MFHLVGIFRTSSPGDSISSDLERAAPGRQGKEPGYIEVCNRGYVIWTSQVFLWTEENQISQIKGFGAFLCIGRCKSGLTGIIPFTCVSPSGPSAQWISQPELPGLAGGSGCSLTVVRSQAFSLLSPLRAHQLTLEGQHCWQLWHSCLLIWQKIFISQEMDLNIFLPGQTAEENPYFNLLAYPVRICGC